MKYKNSLMVGTTSDTGQNKHENCDHESKIYAYSRIYTLLSEICDLTID